MADLLHARRRLYIRTDLLHKHAQRTLHIKCYVLNFLVLVILLEPCKSREQKPGIL